MRQARMSLTVLVAILLLTACGGRTVVNEAGTPVNGPRIDLALGLNELSAAQLDLVTAVQTLERAGEMSADTAASVLRVNAEIARIGQQINRNLAAAADDQTILDGVATLRAAIPGLTSLLPDGAATVTGLIQASLDTILNAAALLEAQ